MNNNNILNFFKQVTNFINKRKLFIFFILTIVYMELIYSIWIYNTVDFSFIFPILFSVSAGFLFTILVLCFNNKVNRNLTVTLTFLLSFIYCFYLVYYTIFKTTFSLYSFVGAKDVLQFKGVIVSSIIDNLLAIMLMFAPVIFIIFTNKRFDFSKNVKSVRYVLISLTLLSFIGSLIAVQMTNGKPNSQYNLYYKVSSPHLMGKKLGLLTTIRLDLKRLIFGFNASLDSKNGLDNLQKQSDNDFSKKDAKFDVAAKYNIIEIPFLDLLNKEKNPKLLSMHKYFSAQKPTAQNQYTGMFKDHNLILITAEAFYPYAINKNLTPTLYKMVNEGFVFNNFYNPLWGVSTSDGEYAACTGLIPKAGVWSMSNSGKNDMRFALGNQLRSLGYKTMAYHNHDYKFYNRHISHPNLGYIYKGLGNGLNVRRRWPESDLEMFDISVKDYINDQPFHSYYMTVSGHFEYNFVGNHMSIKNKKYVKDMPYTDEAKAYLACHLEFEFAMKSLIKQLEDAGVAEKTVIAISPDHYPYGLPKKFIDELSGKVVEENFEIYKANFILWKKGMNRIDVNKLCSSVDILPTLSNLFGLKYDSRLLMGKDILSNHDPLVVFNNRNWITDKGSYNSATGQFIGQVKNENQYINEINNKVENMFKYSANILETDYYKKVLPK